MTLLVDIEQKLEEARDEISILEEELTEARAEVERLKALCADLYLSLRRRNSADHDKRMQRPNTWDGVVIDEWTKPPTSD